MPEVLKMADDYKPSTVETSSRTIGKLAEALSKAQGAMSGALKDSTNPFFKSRYADLESVWSACRKPLSDNGLAIIQTTDYTEGVRIITTLVHSSGEWVQGVLPIMAKDETPQGIGSAITYARRYALAAIVGVYQTDDDAEAAQSAHRAAVDPRIKEYVDRLNKAFELGIDGPVLSIVEELSEDQELKVAVWGKLPSGMRAQIKDRLAQDKS
jgi:hypothetical protein